MRPKPAANNVPIAPAPPPPMVAAPQLLQRPVMLTTKLTSALPASAGPIHQVRIVNGQTCQTMPKTTTAAMGATTAQLTGIVISGPMQTLQISSLNTDIKVGQLGHFNGETRLNIKHLNDKTSHLLNNCSKLFGSFYYNYLVLRARNMGISHY